MSKQSEGISDWLLHNMEKNPNSASALVAAFVTQGPTAIIRFLVMQDLDDEALEILAPFIEGTYHLSPGTFIKEYNNLKGEVPPQLLFAYVASNTLGDNRIIDKEEHRKFIDWLRDHGYSHPSFEHEHN